MKGVAITLGLRRMRTLTQLLQRPLDAWRIGICTSSWSEMDWLSKAYILSIIEKIPPTAIEYLREAIFNRMR